MTLTKGLRDTGLAERVTVHGLKWAKQRLRTPSAVSRVPISAPICSNAGAASWMPGRHF